MAGLLSEPKIEVFPPRRFVGRVRAYTMQTRDAIPAQWVDYMATGARGPGDYFGVAFNADPGTGRFDYLCGREAVDGAQPEGEGQVSIAGAYARFATSGHIATMPAVWAEVYGHWLQGGGLRGRPGPAVEYYPPQFDGMTGAGGFEVWVPVQG